MTFEPRQECARCRRPSVVCYCPHLPTLDTKNRVLVLQHPRERDKAVGTAHMASLCLPNSHVAVGVDFSGYGQVHSWLNDPQYPPILLFPSEDAEDLGRAPPEHPVTLVVIDGTWHQARALVRKNRELLSMPRYGFRPERPSEYRIRREPREDYVSTIEAMSLALGALERDPARFEALLVPFRAMVDMQIAYAEKSKGPRRRAARRVVSDTRSRFPAQLKRPENLLCVAGESNAWPHDKELGRPRHPHELIHWVAHRPHDGSRFEALIAPRMPLSRSPTVHARLDEGMLQQGMSVEDFLAAYQAFQRPDDVLVSWGTYATDLAQEAGVVLPREQIDLRKVIGDVHRIRPGTLESAVALRSLSHDSLGLGRAGERLGMLVSLTRALVQEARPTSTAVHGAHSEAQARLAVDQKAIGDAVVDREAITHVGTHHE